MRFSALTLLILAATAVAAPTDLSLESRTSCDNNNICQGGDTYCCNDGPQLHNATTGGLLAVPLNILASLQCSALTVLGVVVVSSWYVSPAQDV